MKILLINGGPKKNGATAKIIELLERHYFCGVEGKDDIEMQRDAIKLICEEWFR